jgi:hypothetical protein
MSFKFATVVLVSTSRVPLVVHDTPRSASCYRSLLCVRRCTASRVSLPITWDSQPCVTEAVKQRRIVKHRAGNYPAERPEHSLARLSAICSRNNEEKRSTRRRSGERSVLLTARLPERNGAKRWVMHTVEWLGLPQVQPTSSEFGVWWGVKLAKVSLHDIGGRPQFVPRRLADSRPDESRGRVGKSTINSSCMPMVIRQMLYNSFLPSRQSMFISAFAVRRSLIGQLVAESLSVQ